MEKVEGELESNNQMEETQAPLICGLPDDIVFSCLAKVPRRYHAVLKCVSKRWRDLVCSEEWCAYRRKHNLCETWIYALCRDKLDRIWLYVLNPNAPRRSWKRVHAYPPVTFRRKGTGFEALGKKLYLLGGCGWAEDATADAYCYDTSKNSWLEVSPLSTERCYFACQVLDGKIYTVGGLGLQFSVPQSWDIYDPSTDTWKHYSDPIIPAEIDDSFVMNGKIYIRSGKVAGTSNVSALVYEPSSSTWDNMDEEMASGWRGPAVVVDGTLYVLDESSGVTLTMWCKERREWVRFGRLSPLVARPPCQLVAVGGSIFVIGKGCTTVIIDVRHAMKVDGVMVCSSIPKADIIHDFDVFSCKSLAI